MPSLIKRVHSVLYPGYATPQRRETAKQIRTLRSQKGRGARSMLHETYTKSVLAARKEKAKALAKTTKSVKVNKRGGRVIKDPSNYNKIHLPSKAAKRTAIKRAIEKM